MNWVKKTLRPKQQQNTKQRAVKGKILHTQNLHKIFKVPDDF